MWRESWPDQSGDITRALRDADLPAPAMLAGRDGAAAGRRFNVYRNNVAHGLIEALGSIFPAVKAQCGEARFADAARLYLAAHPPRSRLVFEHGRDFAAFLDAFEPARHTMPWLADLARLERAWLDAYHAEDALPMQPATLADVAPDDLAAQCFRAHPAATVIVSRFAVHDLFEAGRAGQVIATPLVPQACLVTRPALSVEVRLLPGGGAVFFSALLSGESLGSALAAALAAAPGFDIPAALAALLQSGAMCAGPDAAS